MNDEKPLIWAQGEYANVKEPIQALKEQGWRHGDIPTASNFNWVLNKMTAELATLRAQTDAYDEKAERFNRLISHLNHRQTHDIEFCLGISRQLCERLRTLVGLIQHRLDIPGISYPMIPAHPPARDELSEIFDEIDRRESEEENAPSLP